MVSLKLIRLLEEHSAEITKAVLRANQEDPRLKHLAALPQSELTDRCELVIHHLGVWLSNPDSREIEKQFEALGRKRYQERIPLRESVLGLQILKRKILGYLRDQGFTRDTLEIYAEEELEHQIGNFFDSAIYYTVSGYEKARDDMLRFACAS
jgi:hypothetical protein